MKQAHKHYSAGENWLCCAAILRRASRYRSFVRSRHCVRPFSIVGKRTSLRDRGGVVGQPRWTIHRFSFRSERQRRHCTSSTLNKDSIKPLGAAPAPPPDTRLHDICRGQPFKWGTCWAEGYVEMDKGIIRFKSENILEVSYGTDRYDARAKKRRFRLFKLG